MITLVAVLYLSAVFCVVVAKVIRSAIRHQERLTAPTRGGRFLQLCQLMADDRAIVRRARKDTV